MNDIDYSVGIDEAGRGPLAGPVHVGAVLAPVNFNFSVFSGLTDSKQMTENRREGVFEKLKSGVKNLQFQVSYSQAATIDKKGINPSIQKAINRAIDRLNLDPENTLIKLDGGLEAPEKYNQETIIKGDESEPVISLASVVAKVTRDRKMRRSSQKFPQFNFDQHKGYGTKTHRENIQKHGLSKVHRESFCDNILV